MPGVDWIPGVSQLKAGLQLITGDVEGAARTQENFIRECPVVSQVTSTVQLIAGDTDGALETQMRCLGTVNNVANGIPVVGHLKGVIHHIVGDEKGGNQALNAASRTTVVIGTGAAAALATGGLAAIPAGIAAGGAYDVAATAITNTPQGYVAAINNVIENPSAGSIFDAVAMPVGDGLAGYSGGQIAKTVSNQIKINNLEVARSAKMDQLNAGLFEDGGMTSGQVHSLGQQINVITSEINVISHGTPRFWFDVKTGEVVAKSSSSNMAVPIVGYVDETDVATATVIYRNLFEMQENALFADSYTEALSNVRDRQRGTNQLNERKQQQPKGNLNQQYPRIPVTTVNELKNSNDDSQRNDPNNRNLQEIFDGQSWLAVHMPIQFNYTIATMVNQAFQGLYHSYIRHFNEWNSIIPNINNTLSRISSLRPYLDTIANASDVDTSRIALNNLLRAEDTSTNQNGLDFTEGEDEKEEEEEADSHVDIHLEIQSAFNDIQMDMLQFIKENAIPANYLGEGVNTNGVQQVYFRVKDTAGNYRVMVLCVSNQLYNPDGRLSEGRPIRTTTTVFFISEEDSKNRIITKLY